MNSSIKEQMHSLEGKIALISGAAGGMGLAIAEAFGDLGATVVMVDIGRDRLLAAEAAMQQAGRKAIGIVADVTRSDGVKAVVKAVASRYGRLNVLVNNVGSTLGMRKPFAESDEDEWERLYRVNLWNMIALSHKSLPLLGKGGAGGSVINVSTIEAFRGYPHGTVYTAFKAGVTGFTHSLALELAPQGIRVNAIAPETTNSWSNMSSRWLPPEENGQIANWVPLGRFGEGSDAAGCAVFLATGMSGWVTGTTIHMDGGCLAAAGWLRTPDGRWTHRPTITGTRWPPAPSEREL